MQMKLADFLRERLIAKRSQAQLARRVGVSSSTVTHWMQGSVPDLHSCLKIAIAMKIDPVQIFQMAGHNDWAQVYQATLAFSQIGDVLGERQFILGIMDDPGKYHEKLQAILEREDADSEATKRMIDIMHKQRDKQAKSEELSA
jgi:transcriptional regulator with XRE-family HTH domain